MFQPDSCYCLSPIQVPNKFVKKLASAAQRTRGCYLIASQESAAAGSDLQMDEFHSIAEKMFSSLVKLHSAENLPDRTHRPAIIYCFNEEIQRFLQAEQKSFGGSEKTPRLTNFQLADETTILQRLASCSAIKENLIYLADLIERQANCFFALMRQAIRNDSKEYKQFQSKLDKSREELAKNEEVDQEAAIYKNLPKSQLIKVLEAMGVGDSRALHSWDRATLDAIFIKLRNNQVPQLPEFSSPDDRAGYELSVTAERTKFVFGTRAHDCDGNLLPRHLSWIGNDEIEVNFRSLGWKTARKSCLSFLISNPLGVPKSVSDHPNHTIEFKHASAPGKCILLFYTKLFADGGEEIHCGNFIRAVYSRSAQSQPFFEWKDWSQQQLFYPQLLEFANRLISAAAPVGNHSNSSQSAPPGGAQPPVAAVAAAGSRICVSCNSSRLRKEFSAYQWKSKRNKCLKCTQNGGESESSAAAGSGSASVGVDSEPDSECCICYNSDSLLSFCGHPIHLVHLQCFQDWKLRCQQRVGDSTATCPLCRAPSIIK